MRRILSNIFKSYEHCRLLSSRSLRFHASLIPKQMLFNPELSIDVMWIEGTHILYIVDTDTGFQNVAGLNGKASKQIWFYIIKL